MNPARPSMTAAIMAFHRALEMTLPPDQRICHDPLAVSFLPVEWAQLLGNREQLLAFMAEKARQFPGVNGAIVARVRFIDDAVTAMLADGLRQLVILGAGYDTRAYRLDGLETPTIVFELDDPVTQADKRAKLESAVGGLPGHVRFVPLDFTTDPLDERLAEAGYDPHQTSLFILEGLVPYLSREAFTAILSVIAQPAAVRRGVVFDYLPPSVVDGTCPWEEGKNMFREVRSHGERFRLGFENDALERLLTEKGFTVLDNINAPDLRRRYFSGDGARRPITPVFWFARAATAPAA